MPKLVLTEICDRCDEECPTEFCDVCDGTFCDDCMPYHDCEGWDDDELDD